MRAAAGPAFVVFAGVVMLPSIALTMFLVAEVHKFVNTGSWQWWWLVGPGTLCCLAWLWLRLTHRQYVRGGRARSVWMAWQLNLIYVACIIGVVFGLVPSTAVAAVSWVFFAGQVAAIPSALVCHFVFRWMSPRWATTERGTS